MEIHKTALTTILRDLSLSQYELKCYLSLLERDTLTAAEIARLARIPRPGAYDALEKLTSKGLCTTKPGDTKRYSASDPALLEEKCNMAVERSMEAELRDLKEREKQLRERARGQKENIKKAIAELKPRYQNSREETSPLDYIEILKDPHQIHKRYMELLRDVREEHLAIVKAPFTGPPEKLKEQIDLAVEVLKRGVRFREVWEPLGDQPEKRWLREFMECLIEHGAEVRIAELLPMKTTIFDSRIVVFALADPVSKQLSLTSQITEHPAFAQSLKILFEFLWGQAQDYHILRS